jgi:hypothetical protein
MLMEYHRLRHSFEILLQRRLSVLRKEHKLEEHVPQTLTALIHDIICCK